MRLKWTHDGWVLITARAANGKVCTFRFETFRWSQVAVNVMRNVRTWQWENREAA